MINKKKLKEIKKWAVDNDWNKTFGGKSKGNRHLFRVNKIAKLLAQKEKADLNICLAGAWLHDTGLIFGNKGHEMAGLKISDDFLSSLKISTKGRKKVLHCIETHEGTIKAKTLEAKIVHDADVIDKSGMLGLIRHCWKLVNSGDRKMEVLQLSEKLKAHLKWRQKKLKTKTAKRIAKAINKKIKKVSNSNIEMNRFIINILPLVKQGLNSDKIVEKINRKKSICKEIKDMLITQLRCDYAKL